MVFSHLGQRFNDKPESAILFLEFTNAILHEMASKVPYMSTITHMQLLDIVYIYIYIIFSGDY